MVRASPHAVLLLRLATAATLAFAASTLGCAPPPPRMCVAEVECGGTSSCVAGRCVAHGTVPAIASARRLLFEPVDFAHVHRGMPSSGGLVPLATLGRADSGVVLLRFHVALPTEADVLEAYVVLERATNVDSDPSPVAFHAARVVDPWEGRSVGWALQPRLEEVRAPVTRVLPASGGRVRLDVRDLVRAWRRRDGITRSTGTGELSVAVVADEVSASGMTFVLAPSPGLESRGDPELTAVTARPAVPPGFFDSHPASASESAAPPLVLGGPELELYVK